MLAAAVVLGAADATPAAGVADTSGDGGGREEGWSTGMTLCAAGCQNVGRKVIANLHELVVVSVKS